MKKFIPLFCCAGLLCSAAFGQAASDLAALYRTPDIPRQTVVSAMPQGPSWQKQWVEARRLAAAGEYRAALQQYQQLQREVRGLTQPCWEMASLLLALHEFDRAAGLLETLVDEFPEHAAYLNALGYAMQEKGNSVRAAELFQQAARLDPDNTIAITGLANAFFSLGKWREALPYVERLYARSPEALSLREKLLKIDLELGRYEQARPLAVQQAGRSNATVNDLRTAAMIHVRLGLDNEAEHDFRELLAKAPDDDQARTWLADYLESHGRYAEALEHLVFLAQREGSDPQLLLRTAGCLLAVKQPARAVAYYEKYLKLFPDNLEISRKLVNIHIALGDEAGTLRALDHYFQIDPDPSTANLRRAGRLYDEAGRYRDAIAAYRQLLTRSPADAGLLEALAHDLEIAGNEEEALRTWSRLAALTPDSKPVYRSMLALLDRLPHPDSKLHSDQASFGKRAATRQYMEYGEEPHSAADSVQSPLEGDKGIGLKATWNDQLLQVLEQLHRLEPEDDQVSLRLVSELLARGEIKAGKAVFEAVATKPLASKELLLGRAKIEQSLAMPDHALADFEEVLRTSSPGDARRDLEFKCLQLAASLGRLSLADRYLAQLSSSEIGPAERLTIASAFRDGGDYDRAHALYQQMISEPTLDQQTKRQALIALAESYERQGLNYEAQQELRLALLADPAANQEEVLARLVELALRSGQEGEAEVWLDRMRAQETHGTQPDELLRLMSVKRLNQEEKFAAAARKAEELLTDADAAAREMYRQRPVVELARLELARAYLGEQRYAEAEKVCRSLTDRTILDFSALVQLREVYTAQGQTQETAAVLTEMLELAGLDLGRMLALTRIFSEAGDHAAMARAAQAAHAMASDSFSAAYLLAEAYSGNGQLSEARELINGLQHAYPDSEAVSALAARVAFVMGLNQEAMSYCNLVLHRDPGRADLELLKGRIYWRKLEWQNSLEVYEGFLTPPVAELFRERSAAAGLSLPAEPKPSLWQRLTFSGPKKEHFIDRVMSAGFMTAPGEQELSGIAAPLYARYLWQRRFAAELAARKSVEQRDDFQAVNQFSQLVEQYPQDESLLFDLAGIFSRMGKLGDEALLYERLAKIDADYPGLEEARERNQLKRMPHLDLTYHYQEESGWNGYKAIRKDAVELGSWTAIKAGSDLDLSLSRLRYSDPDSERTIMSNRALIAYDKNIFNRVDVRLGGGMEDLGGGSDPTELIQCDLTGKVSDRLQGEFSFARDLVSDTLASLGRGITTDSYQGGLFLGLLPRLVTGADYGYAYYSDGNEMKAYSLWASYTILPEPTQLQFKFKYEYRDSREIGGAGAPGPLLADGFAAQDHPYWTPADYWVNSYNILWKHKLSADTLERGTPSYYSAGYALDYDSLGHLIQTVKGCFSLELTRDFTLESALRLINSDEYRDRNLTMSVIYRW